VFVSIKHSKRKKLYAFTGTGTNVVCFRRVLPLRVNALGYLRVRQITTLSHIHLWKLS